MRKWTLLLGTALGLVSACSGAPTAVSPSVDVAFVIPADVPSGVWTLDVDVRATPFDFPATPGESLTTLQQPFTHTSGTKTVLRVRAPARNRAGEWIGVSAFLCVSTGGVWLGDASDTYAQMQEARDRQLHLVRQTDLNCAPPVL